MQIEHALVLAALVIATVLYALVVRSRELSRRLVRSVRASLAASSATALRRAEAARRRETYLPE